MLLPRVTTKDHTNQEELLMTNVQTSPIYKFQTEINIPPNTTDQAIIHPYELLLNGRTTKLFTYVAVLSEEALKAMIQELNELEDVLNWRTFDDVGEVGDTLVYESVSIPDLIKRVNELENASTWGSFDFPEAVVCNDDDFERLLARIACIREAITWEIVDGSEHEIDFWTAVNNSWKGVV